MRGGIGKREQPGRFFKDGQCACSMQFRNSSENVSAFVSSDVAMEP